MSEGHDSTAEVWMAIPGLEDWYSVSSHGRVRREPRRLACGGAVVGNYTLKARVVKPFVTRNGYRSFTPFRDGVRLREVKVHRAVTSAFLGPCPSGKEVNHKDGDKGNNRVENLEYVTRAENIRHAVATGLLPPPVGGRNPRAVLSGSDVLAIRSAWPGRSLQQLADEYGVSKGQIAHIVHRRSWVHIPEEA